MVTSEKLAKPWVYTGHREGFACGSRADGFCMFDPGLRVRRLVCSFSSYSCGKCRCARAHIHHQPSHVPKSFTILVPPDEWFPNCPGTLTAVLMVTPQFCRPLIMPVTPQLTQTFETHKTIHIIASPQLINFIISRACCI